MDRIIGEFVGKGKGPLIILVGGLHGNEWTGIKAIEYILKKIHEDQIEVKGRIIGIRGNMQAISRKERYIDYDLNRCWTDQHLQKLSDNTCQRVFAEDKEVLELKGLFDDYAKYEAILII